MSARVRTFDLSDGMCVKVLGKGLMLLDLGLNRIILTGMLRTEHGDTGGDRERW